MTCIPGAIRGLAQYLVIWRRDGLTDRKGKKGGQDKGRRCAVPASPGRGLVSQGFFELQYDVRGILAMCVLPENLRLLPPRRTSQADS